MRLDENEPRVLKTTLSLLGLLALALVLTATSGCGGDEEEAANDKEGTTGEGEKPEEAAAPAAKPGTPEAAVYAALDDAGARLTKGDIHGFIDFYFPLTELTRVRQKPNGIDAMAEEMAAEPKQLNWLIDVLARARKGKPEFSESGFIATIVLPVPKKKEVPDEPAPSNIIKEPVLTNAAITGYGGDLGQVMNSAMAALNEGDTDAFVSKMFPASELRHPNASARLATLQARLKANPQMIQQMKTDLALASELSPKMEDGGKTAVFEIAGGEAPYGRGTVSLPDRTFKFQLVEGSWRLYDNSTVIRKEIARQSALKPPPVSDFQTGSEEREGDYITLERLGDQWRLGEVKVKQPR